jgi:2-iminobutanoate/2-iminopropanoate deaminase
MKKEVITIPGVQTPGATFNHVVKAGGLLFLTSQLSADLKTGQILTGDITAQTRRALENIRVLLASCGATMDDIVRAVLYLRQERQVEGMSGSVSVIESNYMVERTGPEQPAAHRAR